MSGPPTGPDNSQVISRNALTFSWRCGWFPPLFPRVCLVPRLASALLWGVLPSVSYGCPDVGERIHPPEGGLEYPLYRDELRLVTDERASSKAR